MIVPISPYLPSAEERAASWGETHDLTPQQREEAQAKVDACPSPKDLLGVLLRLSNEYTSADSEQFKNNIVIDWAYLAIGGMLKAHDLKMKPKDYQEFIKKIANLSERMSCVPYSRCYALDKDWFRQVFSQCLPRDSMTLTMFSILRWDYDSLSNPVDDDTTMLLSMDAIARGDLQYFLLRSFGVCPNGTWWMEPGEKRGRLWFVVDQLEDGRVLMQQFERDKETETRHPTITPRAVMVVGKWKKL